MTDLTHTADTTTIADYHWDYDAFSRITCTSYDFSDGADGSSAFSYDATGQLTAADHTAQTDEAFAFDENGNRTMVGYVPGTNNLVISDGTFDYLYDPEGNRTTRTRISNDPADDKTVEYEWDYRNRLTRVVFKNNCGEITKEVLYKYDTFNRRITKIIDADGEGVGVAEQTDFIYDGEDIILALDGEGSLTNRYLHGPAIDQILADEQIAQEQLIWLLADNLGSVRDLVNNSGEVESHIDYTAFGAVETITNNLVQTLYGFTGRERDAETGQTYHRARYYDPLLARWLSEDPIGFSAGDGNLSRYVGNNPVIFVDPTGLFMEQVQGFIGQLKNFGIQVMDGFQGMSEEVGSMLLDVAQMGLDIAGIFDPTGIADAFSGTISAFRSDWWGAGMSVLGFAPGIGDLAKIGRIGKYVDMVKNVINVVGKHADLGAKVAPLLKGLSSVLGNGTKLLGGVLPSSMTKGLENLKGVLDDAIAKLGLGCFVAGTEVIMGDIEIPVELVEKYALAKLSLPRSYTDAAAWGVVGVGVAGFAVSRRRKKQQGGELAPLSFASAGHVDHSPRAEEPGEAPQAAVAVGGDDAEWSQADGSIGGATPRRAWLGATWLALCLLFAVGLFTRSMWSEPATARKGQPSALALAEHQQSRSKPIELVQVGERVHVDTPEAEHDLSLGDDVDPATWRRIELRAPKQDGSWADVMLLRPLAWLDEHDAQVGGTVHISVPECGISGLADVLSIGPCPVIAPGGGRIVTGTYHHSSANVIDLRVEGLREPIGTTGNHPFWSIDRDAFVRADSLQPGERLLGIDGPLAVLGVSHRPLPEPVYNLEVQVAHVYHVASAGVLVHNGQPCDLDWVNVSELKGRQLPGEYTGNKIKRIKKKMKKDGYDPNHPIDIAEVNGKKIILDGHHRARAAGGAGVKKVPVRRKAVTPEEAERLLREAAEAAERFGLPF